MMRGMVLSQRDLNRALLARQLLLERSSQPVADVVEWLLGLQAQAPMPPYLGLFARLSDFDPHELGRGLQSRVFVRLTLMRGTVHLVTVRDAALLRPLVQRVIERGHNGAFGRRMGGADTAVLAVATRELLSEGEALTAREIGRRLVARGIGVDVEAIGNASRVWAPLVQVPPRGVWGKSGQARYAVFEDWTGASLADAPSIDDVALRYLGSFGPASVMDMQNWSGLTRLREVFERLRPQLLTFADESGRDSSTSRQHPVRRPTPPPRSASSASTTTSSSATPTAPESSRAGSPGPPCSPTAASSTTCSSTASSEPPGGSTAPRSTSVPTESSRLLSTRPSRPKPRPPCDSCAATAASPSTVLSRGHGVTP